MRDRLITRCQIEFEDCVTKLLASKPDELGMITTPTPWCDGYTVFKAGIPHLISQIRAALDAKILFAKHEPDWAPLPMGTERSALLRATGGMYLLGAYAFSLEMMNFDYLGHPRFRDFGCGVMAHPNAPEHVRNDLELQAEFPARGLPGLSARMVWFGERLCADLSGGLAH